jgi:hypothetical protein
VETNILHNPVDVKVNPDILKLFDQVVHIALDQENFYSEIPFQNEDNHDSEQ